ncbi:fatty acid hydroxylase [Halioglobus sp. HI00S01]|uniref:sterol desaturase family protein n=1 Tax=Halioglobus sp. HI00S01 TaxID=1822214 RepID=UPI0007C3CE42|nr:sterol desaturase family protein [Halioglobus sp. HI00S01]KZX57039.1 fatty acid hydroxylase [Halioglobus sp. HI00S01]
MTSADVYAIGAPIVVLMIAAEVAFTAARGLPHYDRSDVLGTLGLLGGNILINGITQSTIIGLYFYLYQFRLFDIARELPLWMQWIVIFFAIDLTFYWYHRASHRVRFLWAVHMNHHCSQHMNFSVAFRQAWFGPLSKVPFFIALPLVGFDPSITAVAGVIATLWGVVGHTQVIGRLPRPFEFLFNTPSAHRVHHGSNPEYIDKNYGNIFMLWDHLFGTYAKEESPVRYGLIKNIDSNNPIKLTFYVWQQIARDLLQSRSGHDRWMSVFGPPEWQRSDDAGHTVAQHH